MGLGAEFHAERLKAETYLAQQPWDANGRFVQGKLLDKQRRVRDAAEAYGTPWSGILGRTR